jgi:hypothetical protein
VTIADARGQALKSFPELKSKPKLLERIARLLKQWYEIGYHSGLVDNLPDEGD